MHLERQKRGLTSVLTLPVRAGASFALASMLCAGSANAYKTVETEAGPGVAAPWDNIRTDAAAPPPAIPGYISDLTATSITYSFVPDDGTFGAFIVEFDLDGAEPTEQIIVEPDYNNSVAGAASDVSAGDTSLYSTMTSLFSSVTGSNESAQILWQSIVFESAERWGSMSNLSMQFVSVNDINASATNWDDNADNPDPDEPAEADGPSTVGPLTTATSLVFSNNGQAACLDGAVNARGPATVPDNPNGTVPNTDVDGASNTPCPRDDVGIGGTLPGDIRIAMPPTLGGPGGPSFRVVLPQPDPVTGLNVTGGEILLNPDRPWNDPTGNYRFMRNTLTKAFGLALGLLEVDECGFGQQRIMAVGTATDPETGDTVIEGDAITSRDILSDIGVAPAPYNTFVQGVRNVISSRETIAILSVPEYDPARSNGLTLAETLEDSLPLPFDDIRAIQSLYQDTQGGTDDRDPLTTNIVPLNTHNLGLIGATRDFNIVDESVVDIGRVAIGPPQGIDETLEFSTASLGFLSINPTPNGGTSGADTEDLFRFSLVPALDTGVPIDVEVEITLTPIGQETAPDDSAADACDTASFPTLDTSAAIDLEIEVFTDDGTTNPATAYSATANPAGQADVVRFQTNAFGTFFIEVKRAGAPAGEFVADDASSAATPQLYVVTAQVRNRRFFGGTPVDTHLAEGSYFVDAVTNDPFRDQDAAGPLLNNETEFPINVFEAGIGHNLAPLQENAAVLGITNPATAGAGYRGAGERIGVVGVLHPLTGHEVYNGRAIERVTYGTDFATGLALPGFGSVVGRTLNTQGPIETVALSAAAGAQVGGAVTNGFRGVAPEVDLTSAGVAINTFSDPLGSRYITSLEAVTYLYYSMVDPALVGASNAPATVVLSTWGELGDPRGDSRTALLIDHLADKYDVPFVSSVGGNVISNNEGGFIRSASKAYGRVDTSDECNPDSLGNAETVGQIYYGARAINNTASGFNTTSVAGIGLAANASRAYFENQDLNPDTETLLRGVALDINIPDLVMDTVPFYSGRGYVDTFIYPEAGPQVSERAGVDFVAVSTGIVVRDFSVDSPLRGEGFDPCGYFGHTTEVHFPVPWMAQNPDGSFDPTQTTLYLGDQLDATQPNLDAGTFSGTEMAAGFVAGAYALLQEAGRAHGYTTDPLVLRALLANSARRPVLWTNSPDAIPFPAHTQDFFRGVPFRFDDNGNFSQPATRPREINSYSADPFLGIGSIDIAGALGNYTEGYRFPANTPDQIWPQSFVGQMTTDAPETDPTLPTVSFRPIPLNLGLLEPPEPEQPLEADPGDPALRRGTDGRIGFGGSGGGDPGAPRVGGVSGDPSSESPFDPNEPDVPFDQPPVFTPPTDAEEIQPITVQPIGWDHGMIGRGDLIYLFNTRFFEGDIFEYALTWNRTVSLSDPDFSDPENPDVGQLTELELENLDVYLIPYEPTLELFEQFDDFTFDNDPRQIFGTRGNNDVIEQGRFSFNDESEGFYIMVVRWEDTVYDAFDNLPDSEVEFGLAWKLTPAPNRVIGASDFVADMDMIMVILNSFGLDSDEPGFNPAADLDLNGTVNGLDFNVWLNVFAEQNPPAANVANN